MDRAGGRRQRDRDRDRDGEDEIRQWTTWRIWARKAPPGLGTGRNPATVTRRGFVPVTRVFPVDELDVPSAQWNRSTRGVPAIVMRARAGRCRPGRCGDEAASRLPAQRPPSLPRACCRRRCRRTPVTFRMETCGAGFARATQPDPTRRRVDARRLGLCREQGARGGGARRPRRARLQRPLPRAGLPARAADDATGRARPAAARGGRLRPRASRRTTTSSTGSTRASELSGVGLLLVVPPERLALVRRAGAPPTS